MDKAKNRRHKRSVSESKLTAAPRRFHRRSYSCPGIPFADTIYANDGNYHLNDDTSCDVNDTITDRYEAHDTVNSRNTDQTSFKKDHINQSVTSRNPSSQCEIGRDGRQDLRATEQLFMLEKKYLFKAVRTINIILLYLLVICLFSSNDKMQFSKNDHIYNNSNAFEECNTNQALFKEVKLFSQTMMPCKKRFMSKKLKAHLKFFESGIFNKVELIVFPVNSLNNLFTSLENGSSYENLMNFEWMRIRSFSSFRDAKNVSPIVLSRLGFFYTGTGSDVQCFSCGAVYNYRSLNEDLYQIHRRISPNCLHLSGNDSRNVPIGHRNRSTSNQMSEHLPHDNATSPSVSIDEQSVRSSHISLSSRDVAAQNNIAFPTTINDESRTHTAEPERPLMEHRSRNNVSTAPPIDNTTQTNHLAQASGISSTAINNLSPLGVNFDKPRYPQYAVLTVRMSTYNGWPATQSPRKMAEAGFIYAGYADYTRCFFCGGGLRNWEKGDDPWIEHARWFPRCAYVKQNKGEHFVQLVHERLEEMVQPKRKEQMSSPPRNKETEPQSPCQRSSAKNDPECQTTNLRSLPSYRSVRELGYSPDVIEHSIHILKQQGKNEFSAADILNVIFDKEENDDFFPEQRISYNPRSCESYRRKQTP